MNRQCFLHDFRARNEENLQEVLSDYGAAGLGVYWCVVEQIYENDGHLPLRVCKSIAFALHVEVGMVENIIKNYNLFNNDGERFWTPSALRRIEKKRTVSEARKNAVRKLWEDEKSKGENANKKDETKSCDISTSRISQPEKPV